MPHFEKADWTEWNDERQRYLEYDTQGFEADIAALENHIRVLKKVAPKDKADWPSSNALQIIDELELNLKLAKTWQGSMPQDNQRRSDGNLGAFLFPPQVIYLGDAVLDGLASLYN